MSGILHNPTDQEHDEDAEKGIMEDDWNLIAWFDDSQPSQPPTAQKMIVHAQTQVANYPTVPAITLSSPAKPRQSLISSVRQTDKL